MRRLARPLMFLAAALVGAGGFIHLREWLDVYRFVPSEFPGAFVVTVGFPVNVAVSAIAVAALAFTALKARFRGPVLIAVGLFQLGSLAVLIGSHTGGVLGWMEPGWSGAPMQTLVVEIAALVALVGAAVTTFAGPQQPVAETSAG